MSAHQLFVYASILPNSAVTSVWIDALAVDGTVQTPIGKTFFSPRFGAVVDKFGVSWMIVVPQPQV